MPGKHAPLSAELPKNPPIRKGSPLNNRKAQPLSSGEYSGGAKKQMPANQEKDLSKGIKAVLEDKVLPSVEKIEELAPLKKLKELHRNLREFKIELTDAVEKIRLEAMINDKEMRDIQDDTNIGKFIRSVTKRQAAIKKIGVTPSKMKELAAHAGMVFVSAENELLKAPNYMNIPRVLSEKKPFPGVKLITEGIKNTISTVLTSELSKHKLTTEPLAENIKTKNKHKVKERWKPETIVTTTFGDHRPSTIGDYEVFDINAFMKEVEIDYAKKHKEGGGLELHDNTAKRIREYIESKNGIIPRKAGIVGYHAEVQALNFAFWQQGENKFSKHLADTYIYTHRLSGEIGADFAACANCSGIINGIENVMTGRVEEEQKTMVRKRSLPAERISEDIKTFLSRRYSYQGP